jgi:hypothetical protein
MCRLRVLDVVSRLVFIISTNPGVPGYRKSGSSAGIKIGVAIPQTQLTCLGRAHVGRTGRISSTSFVHVYGIARRTGAFAPYIDRSRSAFARFAPHSGAFDRKQCVSSAVQNRPRVACQPPGRCRLPGQVREGAGGLIA